MTNRTNRFVFNEKSLAKACALRSFLTTEDAPFGDPPGINKQYVVVGLDVAEGFFYFSP